MKQMKVYFSSPKEALDFVNRVTKYSCNMDMKQGCIMIDAKSVLGVIGFVGKVVDLLVYDENCSMLESDLKPYLVA